MSYAAVYHGVNDLRLEKYEKPRIRSDEALLSVRSSGICSTDIRILRSGGSRVNPPIILGHEFSGDIIEVGSDISDLKVGDRVNIPADMSCGNCRLCRAGYHNLCDDLISFGYNVDGSHATYLKIPDRILKKKYWFKLPEDIGYDEASLIEPLACCLHGLLKCKPKVGDIVTILGDGFMGLSQLILAKLLGYSPVILCGRVEHRLKMAERLGADFIIDGRIDDPVLKVKEVTKGSGADIIMISVGNVEAMTQALHMMGKAARINIFAGARSETRLTLDPNIVHYSEALLTGTSGYTPWDYERAFELISSRRIVLEPLISHRYPLTEIKEAIETVEELRGIKVILKP